MTEMRLAIDAACLAKALQGTGQMTADALCGVHGLLFSTESTL